MPAPPIRCWGCNRPAVLVSITVVHSTDPHILAGYLCEQHGRRAREVQARGAECRGSGCVDCGPASVIVADLAEVQA